METRVKIWRTVAHITTTTGIRMNTARMRSTTLTIRSTAVATRGTRTIRMVWMTTYHTSKLRVMVDRRLELKLYKIVLLKIQRRGGPSGVACLNLLLPPWGDGVHQVNLNSYYMRNFTSSVGTTPSFDVHIRREHLERCNRAFRWKYARAHSPPTHFS